MLHHVETFLPASHFLSISLQPTSNQPTHRWLSLGLRSERISANIGHLTLDCDIWNLTCETSEIWHLKFDMWNIWNLTSEICYDVFGHDPWPCEKRPKHSRAAGTPQRNTTKRTWDGNSPTSEAPDSVDQPKHANQAQQHLKMITDINKGLTMTTLSCWLLTRANCFES